MIRMGFGTGRFRRAQWLFLHWSGPRCPAVHKGRGAGKRAAVKAVVRPTNIDFFAASLEELTLGIVIEKVRRYAVVEDGEDDVEKLFSVEAFNEAVSEDKKALAKEFGIDEDPEPGHASGGQAPSAMDVSIGEAVSLVRDKSPFNWCLITPS
uniref:ADF-H domain-containing protein n=1 Tax=Calcidiscus leptoporus TaxID=127549 RepID=A0A7S0IVA3_9EUKA|mmetsp:Transcript_23695/g.54890  ORF Transcript_23695/g.54890 Transcript_23695/m.54890 type:complete len:152 (+) Transcript_23695:53-508(+)